MSCLLVVGAGGHGRVLAEAALENGLWKSIAFVDDNTDASSVVGFPIVGRFSDLAALRGSYSSAAIGLGNAGSRLELLARCAQIGFELPAIVHPTASVSRSASIAHGTVVFAQSAINAGAVLSRGCIVNTGASVDHDCELGEGVHICPGAHLAGNVRVGPRSWIGIGSSVKQGISIGAHVTVGAGAAVICDIPSDVTVVGVPARVQDKRS